MTTATLSEELTTAAATLTADGWVEIGVIADPDHGHDWRVLFNIQTGEGRLRVWGRD
jgi:hypothetical protein